MPKRRGNDPKRRLAERGTRTPSEIAALVAAHPYVGSALHKTRPGDYGFVPTTNPRPSKSLCDARRIVSRKEAGALFRAGARKEMFSTYVRDGLPKYVWSVDAAGEVYESKVGLGGYHGYVLDRTDPMHRVVLEEWPRR